MCPRDRVRAAEHSGAALIGDAPPGYPEAELLGVGGFATSWQVVDEQGQARALKWGRRNSLAAAARFAREADRMQRAFPVAPQLVARGSIDDRPFLLQELIKGPSLLAVLEALEEPMPATEVAALGVAMASALEALHERELLHCDLKPANVFVSRDSCRLIDFGAAQLFQAEEEASAGGVAATPEYAAPELWRGADLRPATDVYSLGCLLYELLTLRLPFVASGSSLPYQHATMRPPRPSSFAPVPAALEDLVLRCLRKDPRERPSCDDLLTRLEDAATGRSLLRGAHRARSHARVPALLLACELSVSAPELDALVGRHLGHVFSHQGHSLVMAWLADECSDAVQRATACAEDLCKLGATRSFLHVDRIGVLDRGSGRELFAACLESTESWRPEGSWNDLRRSAILVQQEALPELHAPLLGRSEELGCVLAAASRAFSNARPVLVTVRGAPGVGRTRFLEECAEALSRTEAGPRVLRVLPGQGPALEDGDVLIDRALDGPLVVLADDLQNFDSETLDALEYAALPANSSMLLLVSASDAFAVQRPLWGHRAEHASTLVLEPLSAEVTSELIAQLLRPAEYIPKAALGKLAAWSGGNAKATIELARTIHREGLVVGGEDAPHRLDTTRLEDVPGQACNEWIASASLQRLPAEVGALARICALCVDGFTSQEVEYIAEGMAIRADLAEAATGLFLLAHVGIVSESGAGYRFVSRGIQLVLAGRIDAASRAEVHTRALAYWQEQAQASGMARLVLQAIAFHAGRLGRAALAARCENQLGQEEAECHRPIEADRCFSNTLALLDSCEAEPDAERLRALLGCGWARYRLDRAREAVALLDEAALLAAQLRDPISEALALLECATALDWAQRFEDSAARVQAASQIAAARSDPKVELRLTLGRGRAAWRSGRTLEAMELLEDAAEAAAAAGDHDARVVALLLLGPALVVAGRLDQAEVRFQELLALCTLAGDRLHLCASYGNRMFLWSARKDAERARDDLRMAMRLAQQVGHPGPERVATYNLAEDLYWSGDDDDEAHQLACRSRQLATCFIDVPVADDALLVARTALALGRHALAEELLLWVREHFDAPQLGPALSCLARMLDLSLRSCLQEDWLTLVRRASTESPGGDRLEIHYWYARWAQRAGVEISDFIDATMELVADQPIWRFRFESLHVHQGPQDGTRGPQ